MRSPLQTIPGWSGARDGVVYHRSEAMGGRLSLTPGLDVTTADVTAATALVYTENQSNLVVLPYRPGKWEAFELPKTSAGVYECRANFLANSPWALATGAPYDVFLTLGQDGPILVRGPAWSSATARAAGLDRSEGRRVLGINPLWVYVGTLYPSATNQCEDSAAKRFVWNCYNRRLRYLVPASISAGSWNYTTDTWRQANANTAHQFELVRGLDEDAVDCSIWQMCYQDTSNVQIANGFGINSTSVNSSLNRGGRSAVAATYFYTFSRYVGLPGLGYSYIAWLERSTATGTTSWYGDGGLDTRLKCQIQGVCFA